MAPVFHLVRHAEGYHNVGVGNDLLSDPRLTPNGIQQCLALRAAFPHHAHVSRLVSSPMRRALQTCIHAFASDKLHPILALDILQETADSPNDIGSSIKTLQSEFGHFADWTYVSPSWTDKSEGSMFEANVDKIAARAALARRFLNDLAGDDCGDIVVVSHAEYLQFLTNDWEDVTLANRSTWSNCEYRSYQVDCVTRDGGENNDVVLRETDESWVRRRGNKARPTPAEQAKWKDQAFGELKFHMKF